MEKAFNYMNLLYYDLETTSEYKTFEDFEAADPMGAKSFKLKYERAIRANNQQWSGTVSEAYTRNAPLYAEYGKIVCISYGLFINGKFSVSSKDITTYENGEEGLVDFIARLFNKCDHKGMFLSGHNIKGFDNPYIFKKLIKYNIRIPFSLNNIGKKPWEIMMWDTAEMMKAGGFSTISLADCTYMFGIETPKDDISGADVHRVYWEDNDVPRIVIYCEKDVVAVMEVAKRIYNCL